MLRAGSMRWRWIASSVCMTSSLRPRPTPSNAFYESVGLHRFRMLMHRLQVRHLGEPACGRPGSIRGVSPLTEPADAVSAFGNDPISQGISDRIDRPPMPRGATPRAPRRLVAGYGRIPCRGCGSISLTSQSTGRSHRLKDCAAPPIFSRRPEGGRRQKIGSSACRLRRSLRDP